MSLHPVVVRMFVESEEFERAMRGLVQTLNDAGPVLLQLQRAVGAPCWCCFGLTNRRTECRRRSAMHAAYDRRRRARRRRNR